jgi:hypothetical protein
VAISHAICDLPDRIVVVEASEGRARTTARARIAALAGVVTVFSRPGGQRTSAAIDPRSFATDPCRGAGGGHAGCSMLGGASIWSAALGEDSLMLGADHRDYLVTASGASLPCRGAGTFPGDGGLLESAIALCSTARHFAVVTRDVPLGELRVTVWGAGADPDRSLDGGAHVAVRLDAKRRSAELRIGRDREACLAFSGAAP